MGVIFRGQVIGPKVARIGGVLKVTLDCEDYNRLFPRSPVGAPDGITTMTQEDGTRVPIDPFATNSGATDGDVFRYLLATYWAGPALDYAGVTDYRTQADVVSWQTALSDLRAICGEWAARTSGALRFWVAPGLDDPGLIAHWRALAPTDLAAAGLTADQLLALGFPALDPSGLIFAPFELDNDDPDGTTRIRPMELSADWDWAAETRRVYVKGATPAPEGSGFVWGTSWPVYAGDAYVDAPGSISAADRNAIGNWHLVQNRRALLTGRGKVAKGSDGWRVGQTLYVSDSVLSGLFGHVLDRTPTVIQRVSGRLVGQGANLGISILGVDISDRVTWEAFSFEETLGSSGKATVVVEIVDGGGFTVYDLSDIVITSEGEDLEYDLEFGDIPAGSLPRELAQPEVRQPANRFIVTVDDPEIPVGFSSLVTAQLANAAGAPLAIANVFLEWVLLQWAHEGSSAVAFWQAAVDRISAYIAVYQGIIDRGGTLTAHQQWAMDADLANLAYDEAQLAAAIAAAPDSELTAGEGYSLLDVSGITDATGRAFTYLSHDSAGTTEVFTIDALALPI